MAEKRYIMVDEVNVVEKTTKDKTKTFEVLNIVDKAGFMYSGYINQFNYIPIVGDELIVVFQEVKLNGKVYNNLISIKEVSNEQS